MNFNNLFANLWVEKYRPTKFEDIILTDANRKFFEEIKQKQETPNIMLTGSAGGGKSSLSKIIVNDILQCQYLYINASDESGIDTIRNKVIGFAQTKSIDGKIKVIILDECDGTSAVSSGLGRTSAQQALRNVMEEYALNTRFILTCNYPHKIIEPLKSRCQEINIVPPFEDCVKRCVEILKQENIKVQNGNRDRFYNLIKSYYPDLRKAINTLQKCVVNGELIIDDNVTKTDFAEEVVVKLLKKNDITQIREHIIHNELKFSNDYHILLKGMFEVFYKLELDINTKRTILLYLSEAMYKHNLVMDKEINCFAVVIAINEILEKKV